MSDKLQGEVALKPHECEHTSQLLKKRKVTQVECDNVKCIFPPCAKKQKRMSA